MMIEIHSKTACPYCTLAKSFLTNHEVVFEEHLYDDFAARQALYDQLNLTGAQRTVPQIFLVHNGTREYIGGYTKLLEANIPARLQVETFDADF